MTTRENRIQAVFFDCDGVLVDSEPAMAEIGALSLRDFGFPAKPDDFTPFIGTGEDAYIGGVVRKYGGTYTLDMKKHMYDRYLELCDRYVRPMPGADTLLKALRNAGYRTAMVTSADLVKAEANLRVLSRTPADFDTVVTGSDVSRKKPEPDIYLCAAERTGSDPARVIVVEDAESGLRSACAAGMVAVGLTSSLSEERLRAAGAHRIIRNLVDLLPLLGLTT